MTKAIPFERSNSGIEAFLSFITRDIANNPCSLHRFSPALANRIEALVGDLDVAPHAQIDGKTVL